MSAAARVVDEATGEILSETSDDELHPDERAVLEDDTSEDTELDTGEGDDTTEDADQVEAAAAAARERAAHVDPEKVFAKVERAAENYGKALTKIEGFETLGFDACPCCSLPGLVLPFRPDDPLEQARRDTVDQYFGTVQADLRMLPNDAECPVCGGWGELQTHSRKPEYKRQPCARCSSTGHIAAPPPQAAPVVAPVEAAAPAPVVYALPETGEADSWGRPGGHPHFGIPPKDVYVA